jgi:hypothetical protein
MPAAGITSNYEPATRPYAVTGWQLRKLLCDEGEQTVRSLLRNSLRRECTGICSSCAKDRLEVLVVWRHCHLQMNKRAVRSR